MTITNEEVAKALGDLSTKMEKIDTDICQKFPGLCQTVDQLGERVATVEGAVSKPPIEAGSDEWKGARKADLEHILFGDCPSCGPIRDEVLTAKGRKLAEIEPETKELETKEPAPEPETSPVPKAGFKFDYDQKTYVRKEG